MGVKKQYTLRLDPLDIERIQEMSGESGQSQAEIVESGLHLVYALAREAKSEEEREYIVRSWCERYEGMKRHAKE